VFCVVARENVAKVSGRHRELDLRADDVVGKLTLDGKVGREVVDRLGEDARPVDRVDGSESVFGVELGVGEERLDDVLKAAKDVLALGEKGRREGEETHLAIVESAVDGEVEDVIVRDSRHLRLLNRRDAALGVEDEDGDVLL
jgi:hypothetical protein